jgi:hypothetical protein
MSWGCIPELANNCQDMTNTSSTYFSILVGAIIGGLISWWIYVRQNKTSQVQQIMLERIEVLNERHDNVLRRIERIEQQHEINLKSLVDLSKQIEELLATAKDSPKNSRDQL